MKAECVSQGEGREVDSTEVRLWTQNEIILINRREFNGKNLS